MDVDATQTASDFVVDLLSGATVATGIVIATGIIAVLFAMFVTTRPIIAFRLWFSFSAALERMCIVIVQKRTICSKLLSERNHRCYCFILATTAAMLQVLCALKYTNHPD